MIAEVPEPGSQRHHHQVAGAAARAMFPFAHQRHARVIFNGERKVHFLLAHARKSNSIASANLPYSSSIRPVEGLIRLGKATLIPAQRPGSSPNCSRSRSQAALSTGNCGASLASSGRHNSLRQNAPLHGRGRSSGVSRQNHKRELSCASAGLRADPLRPHIFSISSSCAAFGFRHHRQHKKNEKRLTPHKSRRYCRPDSRDCR